MSNMLSQFPSGPVKKFKFKYQIEELIYIFSIGTAGTIHPPVARNIAISLFLLPNHGPRRHWRFGDRFARALNIPVVTFNSVGYLATLAEQAMKLLTKQQKWVYRKKNIQPCPVPHTDLRPLFKEYIDQTWQAEWDELPANKLHSIFPTVNSFTKLPLCQNFSKVSALRRLSVS